MLSRRALLAAVMWLLPLASWGQEPPPDGPGGPPGMQGFMPVPPEQQRLDRLREEFVTTATPAAARLQQLVALKARYADPGDFDALLGERAQLRQAAAADLASADALVGSFKSAYDAMEEQGRRHDPRFAQHVMGPPFAGYRQAYADMSRLPATLRAALTEDDDAFRAARVLERRERRKLLLWGGGALAVALLVLGLTLLQRRAIATAVLDATRTAQLMTPPAAAPAALPAPAPVEGRLIGDNFQVERLLGEGGMGMVYLATDVSLRRRVAIKRMRDELLQGGPETEAFMNEARLVAALKHPNIVEIYSIVKEPGLVYLVFEYVEGRSLREWIGLSGKLTVPGAKSVLYQIGLALDHAHAQKVVHRDLKPANVMVDPRGVAKVMDFGIAHQAQRTLARVTHVNASGTPAYMAPEQELGEASRAADVYAAGVCLYEMLTGTLPFQGPNFLAQKNAMRYAAPSAVTPALPAGTDGVVARALAADPGARYASAGELAQAFLSLG